MSLEKLAKGMGSAVKIIVYGFILIFVLGLIIAFGVGGDSTTEKPVEVSKIDPAVLKNSPKVVESEGAAKSNDAAASTPVAQKDSIESKVKVELLSLAPDNYLDVLNAYAAVALKVKITNDSDKAIHGVKGRLQLKNAFGDNAGAFSIETDETIQPGKSREFNWSYKISTYDSDDQKMATLKKWTAEFKVEKILVE